MSAEIYLCISIGFAFLAAELSRRDGTHKGDYGGFVIASVATACLFLIISGLAAAARANREDRREAGMVHEVVENRQATPGKESLSGDSKPQ